MISREHLTPDLLAELRPLVIANHAATGSEAPLDPQWEALAGLDAGDAMAVVVARIEGRAVGYVAHVMHRHQLYGERWATCVAVYLEPAHRGLARGLISEAERLAYEAGAHMVTYGVPTNRPAAFLWHQGYTAVETVMGKRLRAGALR
jgi:GNAT superfamily N-acetyltransferase